MINEEITSGIPADRIVLGGFSQGAAVSIVYSLVTETKLAGFACLSGYLPLTGEKLKKVTEKKYHADVFAIITFF